MIDKKKSAPARKMERSPKAPAPKAVRPIVAEKAAHPDGSAAAAPRPARAAPPGHETPSKTAAPAPPLNQRGCFESAMRLFHARQLREARELFLRASEGPERDVAQRAQLHTAMCDRRLEQPPMNLRSAEDYYNYGVALINTHKAAEARVQLEKALEISPGAEHIHYALALAQALSGDPINAYANLKRAIELEPRNRLIARQDADFAPLAHQPPFDSLLFPERNAWSDRNAWSEEHAWPEKTSFPEKHPWPGKKAW